MAESERQPPESRGEHLILYDGVCALCNGLNVFVLRRDTRRTFDFASQQSDSGRSMLRRFGRDAGDLTSVFVVVSYRSGSPNLLSKAAAALFIMKQLGPPWRWLALASVLPAPLLDSVYDLVARHRYRLFGRYDTCLLPRTEYKARFLDV